MGSTPLIWINPSPTFLFLPIMSSTLYLYSTIQLQLKSMTRLSGAHPFRRFLRQFGNDFLEILHRTFPRHW